MKPDRFARVKELLIQAKDLPEKERKTLIEEACRDDPDLREHVEKLLALSDDPHRLVKTGGAIPSSPPDPGKVTASTIAAAPSSRRIAGYQILRKLGEGGMGVVYKARQEHPHRTVALKVVRRDIKAGDSALKRFRFEIQVLGQLNHPGIAQVYDAGTAEDGTPYVVMEYVPGLRPLEYAEKRQLDLRARLELMAQVCDAIHHAHEKGIIHRDLKPANILVVDAKGSQGQAKILDFGVARAVPSALQPATLRTQTGQLVGTLAYMSPEQVVGRTEDLDARSDVYQLGVILYELLVGHRPYEVDGLPLAEAARLIAEEEPDRLGSMDPRWRGDVETIAGKALEKDRNRRYASAAELGEDIRRSLRGDPITARPPSAVHRLRLFGRRHKVLTQFGALAIIALLIGLLVPRLADLMPGGPPDDPSVAVLFFDNLGPSADDDYFAAGLTEDVITKLSQIDALKVSSRSAVKQYRGHDVDPTTIRRDLGINYFLEGSLRRNSEGLRITAQLIDARSGFHVWAETFDGSLDDIFAIQDTIATSIAEALGVTIDSDQKQSMATRWTNNAQAYAYYLTGREKFLLERYYVPDWSREPMVWFERALDLDPDYAPALASLAHALAAAWSIGTRRPGQMERAAALAERAKALDATLWDAWLADAFIAFRSGRIDEAVGPLETLTRMAPEYAEGHYYLAWVYANLERQEEAIESYKRAWELNHRASMFRNLISPYITLGRFDEAERMIEDGLERYPDDPDILGAKATLLRARGRFSEAIELGRATAEFHPDHYHVSFWLAWRLAEAGHEAEADSIMARALERWPDIPETWEDAAAVDMEAGDLDEAERHLRRVLELEPYYDAAWRKLQNIARRRGDLVEHERIARYRTEYWPDSWWCETGLAWTLDQLGRTEEAEEAYRGAVQRWPDVHGTLEALAWFYLRQDRNDDAEEVMDECARRWSDDPDVLLQLSRMYNSMRQYDVSETWARKALELQPASRAAHAQIAWAFWEQGEFDDAAEWFQKAIDLGPPDYDDYRGLIQSLRQMGRLDEAVTFMRRFVELKPIEARGWADLGWAQTNTGELYQAAVAYERALDLEPELTRAVSGLGYVSGLLGNFERRIDMLERAAALDTTNAEPWQSIALTAFFFLGDDERAESALRKALARTEEPHMVGSCLSMLAQIHSARGDEESARDYYADARAKLDEALRARPEDVAVLLNSAMVYARSGDAETARSLTDRALGLPSFGASSDWTVAACVMAVTSDHDRAFEYLQKAVDRGQVNRHMLRTDPDLDNLRDDPRFEAFVASVR